MEENLQLVPLHNKLAKEKYELLVNDDKIMNEITDLVNNLSDHIINKKEARLGILKIVVDVIIKMED
jgi:hypothetical protein